MVEITKAQFFKVGADLFGKDRKLWVFVCPTCKREQSGESIENQMVRGEPSQRFGILKDGHNVQPNCVCYSPECNWTANGLFNTGNLLILNPKIEHNANRKENCFYVFNFVGHKWGDDNAA